MFRAIIDFFLNYWNAAIEILLLAIAIYYGYLYFRGTRGAKVLTGLAILFITLTLVSQILNLTVISWLLRSLTAFLAIALVVIFQPELRRALAEFEIISRIMAVSPPGRLLNCTALCGQCQHLLAL